MHRSALSRQNLAHAVHGFFRTAGACLGTFVLLNYACGAFIEGFDVDFLWISFPGLLAPAWTAAAVAGGVALVWAAARPIRRRRVATLTEAALAVLAAGALWNVIGFYFLLGSGEIRSGFPFPSSMLVVIVTGASAWRTWREHVLGSRIDAGDGVGRLVAVHAASFAAVALLGPLAFICTYGATDYSPMDPSRGADCIVVFGAKVGDDGRPSLALADRVREGARLWRAERGRHLVLTGAVGANGSSEPRAMRELALAEGVAAEAIVMDESGADTYRSVLGAARLMRERGWRSSISVSHYFHLLRIQMSARRVGMETLTVPAPMTRRLRREPYYLLRECAAFYVYFFFRWGGAEDAARNAVAGGGPSM